MPEAVSAQSVTVERTTPSQALGVLSVCMISDDFLPAATGVGTHIQLVARELASRGHRLSVITSRRRGEPQFEIWNGIRIYRTATLKVYGFYQALPRQATVRRILLENNVDIIHYHYLGFMLMSTHKAARGLEAKHVYTYHMTVDHLTQPFLMKPFRRILFRLHVNYCNKFDLVLAPSANLIQQIKQHGIKTPTRFLSNPVVLEYVPDIQRPKESKDFLVLYVGRLNPEKNLPYLLEAFGALVQKHNDCKLRIAGEGSSKNELMRLTQRLKLESHVEFLGFVQHKDLVQHYIAADLFVLPSLVEAQPMVVIEAMRFSKPIIVTNRMVSANELVDDFKNGFIVDPDSVEDLTEKLTLLYEDTGLRQEMARQSFEKSEGFVPERIIDQLEEHYASLL